MGTRRTLSGGFQTIIATHSEAMIRRLPADLIRFTVRSTNGIAVREHVSHDEVMVALGYEQSVKYLALVEDLLVEEILRNGARVFRFFLEIATYLGLDHAFVRRTLIACWLNGVEVREQAREMVAGIETAVGNQRR